MTPDERFAAELMQLVHAFNKIADALTTMAILMEKRFQKEYPVKVPRDAVITRVPSEEDKLLEELGSTDESLEDWTTLGPRERGVADKQKKKE